MHGDYPPRLSVAELRQEFEAYQEYRRGRVEEPTIIADRTHIGQFLGWLETGRTRRDIDDLMREYMPSGESPEA
jgi:hypothetical protein